MITKFKLFENQEFVQKCWKIPIDDYFFVRLEKIGMSEEIQKSIYEHYCDLHSVERIEISSVLVGKDDYGGETSDWHWDFNTDINYKDLDRYIFDGDEYKYQGEVNATQEDLDDWVLRNDAKKYNL